MSTTETQQAAGRTSELQLTTFRSGEVLIGVDIQCVQEINRDLEMTIVPHASPWVCGVVNLRGEVVTVLDLRRILGLGEAAEIGGESRNVILDVDGEKIGLLVDCVEDVVTVRQDDLDPPPANVSGVDERFFEAVFAMESELLVVLNVEEALAVEVREEQRGD